MMEDFKRLASVLDTEFNMIFLVRIHEYRESTTDAL